MRVQLVHLGSRRPDQMYLGPKSYDIDKIFYEGTKLGCIMAPQECEADAGRDFSFVAGAAFTPAHRHYVHSQIRRFLQSPSIPIFSEGKKHIGIVPYPVRFKAKHQPCSMTLISLTSEKEAIATRVEREPWLAKVSQEASDDIGGNETSANIAQDLSSEISYDNSEFLDKWGYVENDVELPAYGDSGSEGEYDESTLREIAQEAAQARGPYGGFEAPRIRRLSEAEVQSCMDHCVREIMKRWHDEEKAKVEAAAYFIWKKERAGDWHRFTMQQASLCSALEKRMACLTHDIIHEDWWSKRNVEQQCQILEPTIYDMEEAKWKIRLVRSEMSPVAPIADEDPVRRSKSQAAGAPRARPTPSEMTVQGGHDLDDLDDFIVWDDDPVTVEPLVTQEPWAENANGEPNELKRVAAETFNSDEDALVSETGSHDGHAEPTTFKEYASGETSIQKAAGRIIIPSDDIEAIHAQEPEGLMNHEDRKRMLIWVLSRSKQSTLVLAKQVITMLPYSFIKDTVGLAMQNFMEKKIRLDDLNGKVSEALMQLALWFILWIVPKVPASNGVQHEHFHQAYRSIEQFQPFFEFLQSRVRNGQEFADTEADLEESIQAVAMRLNMPHHKRVHEVLIDAATTAQQTSARDRMFQDKARREAQAFPANIANSGGELDVIVNPGRRTEQDPIKLDIEFGNGIRLQKHQIEGLQFLWREITAEQIDFQGCLLAHTMGLGKTIQICALLVALRQAGLSKCENIRRQVPASLQTFRVLLLCPPALLEHWVDELRHWTPNSRCNMLGLVSNIHRMTRVERIDGIVSWAEGAGILLLSYNMFTMFMLNKNTSGGRTPVPAERHKMTRDMLLEKPTLVIADEAHAFKNVSSNLRQSVDQIRTQSRIAMTGSPLSNNLSEYYSLIDWIAPGYLGRPLEFRANYEEFIAEGLYTDSTEIEYREALKRLKALETTLEPKVHRADHSVLHEMLQGKKEFVIKVRINPVQTMLYNILVETVQHYFEADENNQTHLWFCLRYLQLLCTDPALFLNTLKASSQNRVVMRRGRRAKTALASDDGEVLDDPEVMEIPQVAAAQIAQTILGRIESVAAQCGLSADDIERAATLPSEKMVILLKIIRYAIDVQDKVLIFSHRPPALEAVERQLSVLHIAFSRIDGRTAPAQRQAMCKSFNLNSIPVCLVSTRAGGVGLNLYGANRVIILDEWFNPTDEQQAIGRAYRIGQQKPVYVYKLAVAGTFEDSIQNQAVFKEQLATRVVDKRNPLRGASKGARQYIFYPRAPVIGTLVGFDEQDPAVLGQLIREQARSDNNTAEFTICSITCVDSFTTEVDDRLSEEEMREAEEWRKANELKRSEATKEQERPVPGPTDGQTSKNE